jgi:hypothetical protein
MVWFTRFTRFADVHLVYGQERGQSCGPSSVVMCDAKIKKFTAPQAIHSEATVRGLYGGDFVHTNANVSGLVTLLNRLQLGSWTAAPYSFDLLCNKVGVSSALSGPTVNVNPVILRIGWTNGGGHFVVVDTIRSLGGSHWASVCDPWDADVHITSFDSAGFTYRAQPQLVVNFGGSATHIWADQSGQVHSQDRADFGYAPAGSTGTPNWIIHQT